MSRPTTQQQVVLRLLADGQWHTSLEFVDAGLLRAAARVFELRREGYAIETRRVKKDARGFTLFAYRLRRSADDLEADAELKRIQAKFPDLVGAQPERRQSPAIVDDCMDCGEREPLTDVGDGRWLCEACAAANVAFGEVVF